MADTKLNNSNPLEFLIIALCGLSGGHGIEENRVLLVYPPYWTVGHGQVFLQGNNVYCSIQVTARSPPVFKQVAPGHYQPGAFL